MSRLCEDTSKISQSWMNKGITSVINGVNSYSDILTKYQNTQRGNLRIKINTIQGSGEKFQNMLIQLDNNVDIRNIGDSVFNDLIQGKYTLSYTAEEKKYMKLGRNTVLDKFLDTTKKKEEAIKIQGQLYGKYMYEVHNQYDRWLSNMINYTRSNNGPQGYIDILQKAKDNLPNFSARLNTIGKNGYVYKASDLLEITNGNGIYKLNSYLGIDLFSSRDYKLGGKVKTPEELIPVKQAYEFYGKEFAGQYTDDLVRQFDLTTSKGGGYIDNALNSSAVKFGNKAIRLANIPMRFGPGNIPIFLQSALGYASDMAADRKLAKNLGMSNMSDYDNAFWKIGEDNGFFGRDIRGYTEDQVKALNEVIDIANEGAETNEGFMAKISTKTQAILEGIAQSRGQRTDIYNNVRSIADIADILFDPMQKRKAFDDAVISEFGSREGFVFAYNKDSAKAISRVNDKYSWYLELQRGMTNIGGFNFNIGGSDSKILMRSVSSMFSYLGSRGRAMTSNGIYHVFGGFGDYITELSKTGDYKKAGAAWLKHYSSPSFVTFLNRAAVSIHNSYQANKLTRKDGEISFSDLPELLKTFASLWSYGNAIQSNGINRAIINTAMSLDKDYLIAYNGQKLSNELYNDVPYSNLVMISIADGFGREFLRQGNIALALWKAKSSNDSLLTQQGRLDFLGETMDLTLQNYKFYGMSNGQGFNEGFVSPNLLPNLLLGNTDEVAAGNYDTYRKAKAYQNYIDESNAMYQVANSFFGASILGKFLKYKEQVKDDEINDIVKNEKYTSDAIKYFEDGDMVKLLQIAGKDYVTGKSGVGADGKGGAAFNNYFLDKILGDDYLQYIEKKTDGKYVDFFYDLVNTKGTVGDRYNEIAKGLKGTKYEGLIKDGQLNTDELVKYLNSTDDKNKIYPGLMNFFGKEFNNETDKKLAAYGVFKMLARVTYNELQNGRLIYNPNTRKISSLQDVLKANGYTASKYLDDRTTTRQYVQDGDTRKLSKYGGKKDGKVIGNRKEINEQAIIETFGADLKVYNGPEYIAAYSNLLYNHSSISKDIQAAKIYTMHGGKEVGDIGDVYTSDYELDKMVKTIVLVNERNKRGKGVESSKLFNDALRSYNLKLDIPANATPEEKSAIYDKKNLFKITMTADAIANLDTNGVAKEVINEFAANSITFASENYIKALYARYDDLPPAMQRGFNKAVGYLYGKSEQIWEDAKGFMTRKLIADGLASGGGKGGGKKGKKIKVPGIESAIIAKGSLPKLSLSGDRYTPTKYNSGKLTKDDINRLNAISSPNLQEKSVQYDNRNPSKSIGGAIEKGKSATKSKLKISKKVGKAFVF